jgi:hypothetical protein
MGQKTSLSAKGRAKAREGIAHGQKAIAGYQDVISDLSSDDDNADMIKAVKILMNGARDVVAHFRSTLAADAEKAAAKVLDTWAAADVRRF